MLTDLLELLPTRWLHLIARLFGFDLRNEWTDFCPCEEN